MAMADMRAVRTTVSAEAAPIERLAGLEASRSSLGSLLRPLADPRSDASHMATALAHYDRRKRLLHGRDGAVGLQVDAPATARLLSLSDHKHVEQLGAAVAALDQAMEVVRQQEKEDGPPQQQLHEAKSAAVPARNLLLAVANALIAQSVEECVSTRQNVCVWTKQSEKRLLLLQWMLARPAGSNAVISALLDGTSDSSDKSRQLTACLVCFELLQRQRRLADGGSTCGHVASLIEPLCDIVEHRTGRNGSGGCKPSLLGLAALDALVLVCAEVSRFDLQFDRHLMQKGVTTVLQAIEVWHGASPRRGMFMLAVKQLRMYVRICQVTQEHGHGTPQLSWHWNASAVWLCTRSDAVVSAKKRLAPLIITEIDRAYNAREDERSRITEDGSPPDSHRASAYIRRVCALLSLARDTDELLRSVFVTDNTTGQLLLLLMSLLGSTDVPTRALALDMLRWLIVDAGVSEGRRSCGRLLRSSHELESFLSLMIRTLDSKIVGAAIPLDVLGLVGAFIVSRNVSIEDEILAPLSLPTATISGLAVRLSIISSVLDQCDRFAIDPALLCRWRRYVTPAVLITIQHCSPTIRQISASLVPRLDLVRCVQKVTMSSDVNDDTASKIIELALTCSRGDDTKTEDIVSAVVSKLANASRSSHSSNVMSPGHITVALPSSEVDTSAGLRQDRFLSASISGWCLCIPLSTKRLVVIVLLRKLFGAPQDALLLKWLRELALLGWMDEPSIFAGIVSTITTHMRSLERLTEAMLADDSPFSARAVQMLLFSRLAPNLVLRVIPRQSFHMACRHETTSVLCVKEDLAHVESYIKTPTKGNDQMQVLSHLLWLEILDPLEFKEVKMIAVELLAKFPAGEVLPHVLGHTVAFIYEQGVPAAVLKFLSPVSSTMPDSCGVVTAKLMMYYLNRLFNENAVELQGDDMLVTLTVSVLLTLFTIPCHDATTSAERSPLVDIQIGAIECLSVMVTHAMADSTTGLTIVEQLLDIMLLWEVLSESSALEGEATHATVKGMMMDFTEMTDSTVQMRICCCNVFLSSLSKMDLLALVRFQTRVIIARIMPGIVLDMPAPIRSGCFQILFTFIFRAGPSLEESDSGSQDLIVRCVHASVDALGPSSTSDQIAMSALKLLGAIVGKVPWFWRRLKPDAKKTVIGCLQLQRDSPVPSPQVRELSHSLLVALETD